MPRSPAPIEVIEEKLRSPTEGVRVVALLHAAAHGAGAAPLAAEIARKLDDPSAAVQWHAMGTFLSVAEGEPALEAVPVLAAYLARDNPPTMLVSRSLSALAHLGVAARPALDVVLRWWDALPDGFERASALAALFAMAPDDARVQGIFTSAVRSSDYSVQSTAHELLDAAPADVVDRVTDDACAQVRDAADDTEREDAANIVNALTPLRPDRAREIATFLFEHGTCGGAALGIVERLPQPVPASLVDAVVDLVRDGDPIAEHAIGFLVRSTLPRDALRALCVETLDKHAAAHPLGGLAGASSDTFGRAAEALATMGPDPVVAQKLVAWLARVAKTKWPAGKKQRPSWYTVADVVVAARALAPEERAVADAVLAVTRTAKRFLDVDASGVNDFLRKIEISPAGAAPLPEDDEDPADTGSDPELDPEPEPELPDFPPEAPPRPPLVVAPLSRRAFVAIANAMAAGEKAAKVDASAAPEEIAGAVDRAIRRARRSQKMLSAARIDGLAALWGKAVAAATGWTWAHVVDGDDKHVCLVSKDHAHACAPFSFMRGQAEPDREVTALLVFNMLGAGDLPESKPGALSFVG